MIEILKICTRCKQAKQHSEFRSRIGLKINKDGLSPTCRICERDIKREYDIRKKATRPPKFCYVCSIEKHHSEFYSTPLSRDKSGYKCKNCVIQLDKKKEDEKLQRQFELRIQHKDGTKRCTSCRIFKPYDKFWKDNLTTDGFIPSCIECKNKSELKYKERRARNRKDWRVKNLEHSKNYHNKWRRNKIKTDIFFKLRCNTTTAITNMIRKNNFINKKIDRFNKKILEHLPYSIEKLKIYIESLWEPWMNWDNWGKFDSNRKTWQIDHIIPQSLLAFDSFGHPNFLKCWALVNLRPLDTIENIKKGKKIIDLESGLELAKPLELEI